MVTIKIILLGSNHLFTFPPLKHIAAIITDVATGREFLLNHPFGSYDNRDTRARHSDRALSLYRRAESNLCISTVTLMSKMNYDEFLWVFNNEFSHEFSWMSNNCSTAVKRALSFFFPGYSYANSYTYLQMVCLPYFLLVLTLEAYDLDTPQGVYELAVALAGQHANQLGAVPIIENNHKVETDDDSYQAYEPTPDEATMTRLLRPLGMI